MLAKLSVFALFEGARAFGSIEPLSYEPLMCEDAQVQSPRDVTAGYMGALKEPAPPIMDFSGLTHVNTHFTLGAEHYSEGEYDMAYQAATGETMDTTPGWMCDASMATDAQMAAFPFKWCEGVEVGKTYELHWVFSSGGRYPGYPVIGPAGAAAYPAGTEIIDGIGGGLAVQVNPYMGMQAMVFTVVNDDMYDIADLMYGAMDYASGDIVAYQGSTTGSSYDNTVCSPYAVTWHVDKTCHMVSAKSMDEMCYMMKDSYRMSHDVMPHSSRPLVPKGCSAESAHEHMWSPTMSPTMAPTYEPTYAPKTM